MFRYDMGIPTKLGDGSDTYCHDFNDKIYSGRVASARKCYCLLSARLCFLCRAVRKCKLDFVYVDVIGMALVHSL